MKRIITSSMNHARSYGLTIINCANDNHVYDYHPGGIVYHGSSLNSDLTFNDKIHNFDVTKSSFYSLGTHCGTYNQAKYAIDNRYNGKGIIWEINLSHNIQLSSEIQDKGVWSDRDSVFEILLSGFDVEIFQKDVESFGTINHNVIKLQDYIITRCECPNPVVVYKNKYEKNEKDIILLTNDSIISCRCIKIIE